MTLSRAGSDETYETASDMFDAMDREYEAKPWHYKARIRLSGWWNHGWLYELRPGTNWRRVKFFIQRGRRGWADCDTWSLDHYLSRVVGESVHHLAEHSHGWPQSEKFPKYEDWQAHLHALADAYLHWNELDDLDMQDFYGPEWKNPEHKGRYEPVGSGPEWHRELMERERQRRDETKTEMKKLIDVWGSLWD